MTEEMRKALDEAIQDLADAREYVNNAYRVLNKLYDKLEEKE